ncbi:MAG TPA: M28 family peptidase [Cyclobacteriaceae bacterium]|nr:M28 family peptidase [Cyclobacteriaceae bacterium]HRJ81855.1 M28 family peptidase [Cyclobacteriaceae bacterium]
MKIKFLVFWLVVVFVGVHAQDPVAQKYGQLVTAADLKEYLTIIASDALEGRRTGSRGQRMAAAFIAAHFEEHGLQGPVNGSYFQPVMLYTSGIPEVSFNAGGIPLKENEEFVYFGSGDTGGLLQLPLVFAGQGSEEDLTQVDVKGKAALVFLDANASLRNNPAMAKLREKEAKLMVLVMNSEEDFKTMAGQLRMFAGGRMSLTKGAATPNLGLFLVTPAAAGKIFKSTPEKLKKAAADKALGKVKPSSLAFTVAQKQKEIKTDNVLGFLEGSDKKDEVIVITAHYDHIGKRASGEGDLINNGADDDGSGTVSVLSLAKAFAQAKKDGKGPRRSILFMTVTGEEEGLLGSQFYTDNSPVFPLEKTVVNLNIDMVGRRDPQHKDSAPYIYVIGSDKLSSELHSLSEEVNKKYTNLIFDYTYNDQNHPERLYYRSDHWNFAKKNIPIIFYFDGIHEDYHQPSDEVDKIEFDLMAKRAQCIFYTAWEIANRDGRITADKK